MKKDICRLTVREAVNFERNGRIPNCANHVHCSRVEAAHLLGKDIADAEARIVGYHYDEKAKKSYVFLVDLHPRVWKPRAGSMQLVKGVISGRRGQFHYPVEASGASGRRTSVLDINEPFKGASVSPA